MTRNILVVLAGIALAFPLAGCAKNERAEPAPRADGQVDRAPRADEGSRQRQGALNQQGAEALLRQAEESERQGEFSQAMNAYERLRSYPEGSRPKDLDQRIEALRQKMAAGAGGATAPAPGDATGPARAPATQPVEPR